jgi:alkylation response protein AidB-like acyl-CoA dehydrogenase
MFELAANEEQRALVETVRAYAKDELRPAARQAEHARDVPATVASQLRAMGMTAPLPENVGGQGVPDLLTHVMLAEELAWGDPGIAYSLMVSGQAGLIIARCGREDQHRRLLRRFTVGDPVSSSVLLYEGFGRRPSEMATRATRHGASRWKLRGEKVSVAEPGSAQIAVIFARRDGDGELAAFVLEGWPAELRVTRDDRKSGKIALAAAHTGSVTIDGLEVDEGARLDGGTALDLAKAMARFRLLVPALAIGCARAAIELAIDYAKERIAFGRPIAAFQGISFPIADQTMAIDAARLELWDAAGAIENSTNAAAIERITNQVVARSCAVALQATRDGVQVLGGHGFITEYPVERWYRSAIALAAIDFDPLASPASFD